MPADLAFRIWSGPNPCCLTELDVASGVVLGCVDVKDHESAPEPASSPIDVLQDEACRLLESGPCVVAFSGGRDSSALLAVFTSVARRFGLAEPVAATLRWEGDASSDESEWQEQVVRSLGISQWEVIRPAEDLDLLGPEATAALSKHGLLWPPPAYAICPMLRRASGGTLISGEGGDETFGLWPYAKVWASLSARRRPPVRELAKLAAGFTPLTLRRALWRWREPPYQDWLTPGARRTYGRALSTEMATDPVWWDDYLAVMRRSRSITLGLETMTWLAGEEGARFVTPFHNPAFLDAMARLGGRRGMGGRTSIMTALFSDLLAPAILTRATKASFGGVFWGPASRQFARTWTGEGFDPSLVEVERLRAAWLAPTPVAGSALPLHAAWLNGHPG